MPADVDENLRVTVVLTVPKDTPAELVQRAVSSVESQDLEKEHWDLHVMLDQYSAGVLALQLLGVEKATTAWVTLMSHKEYWAPEFLRENLNAALFGVPSALSKRGEMLEYLRENQT